MASEKRHAQVGQCKHCRKRIIIEKGQTALHVHHEVPPCPEYLKLLGELDDISQGQRSITVVFEPETV